MSAVMVLLQMTLVCFCLSYLHFAISTGLSGHSDYIRSPSMKIHLVRLVITSFMADVCSITHACDPPAIDPAFDYRFAVLCILLRHDYLCCLLGFEEVDTDE